MELNNNDQIKIKAYLDNPTNQSVINQLGSIYWPSLIKTVCEIIHNDENLDTFIKADSDFLNAGIIDNILENDEETRTDLHRNTTCYNHLSLQTMTSWLKDTLWRINSGDKKALLENEIKMLELQQAKIQNEISTLQRQRQDLLLRVFAGISNPAIITQIKTLVSIDFLTCQDLQIKMEIEKGVFFSVKDRRKFVELVTQLKKKNEHKDGLISLVKSAQDKQAVLRFNTQINKLLVSSVTIDGSKVIKKKELNELQNDQSVLSPIELENRVRRELEYLRDLLNLSAKRSHMESCPALRTGVRYFTQKQAALCFNTILEFDPLLFNNYRVSLFGKPTVLLVPGSGNGLYDWKNNRLVIPMFPSGGNFMASIATATIEYRLDVDEDKGLINSYQKLPENTNIRSLISLRANLTKDYLKWMTSECMGYKVLNKETRAWFEHEIAPSKNDIFCPPEYQPFLLSKKKFQNIYKKVISNINASSDKPSREDLWAASILLYQQGKYNDSFNYLNNLLAQYPHYVFGYYNLGILGIKTSQKQDAIKGFKEFIKRNPKSWWASVASDHIRRLQIN